MRAWLIAIALLLPSPAGAQTVFFDDFEGNALLPHWVQPPASHWEYNVSNSMLNVTGLFYPSHPKSPSNFAGIGVGFTSQTDFRADVWMGWDEGQQPHRLQMDLSSGPAGGGSIIASFGYRNEAWSGPTPVIFAGASNQGFSMPAPAAGIHQFTVTRHGSQFTFYFDQSPFASFADMFGSPAAGLGFTFLGPYPGQLGAFHIDRVLVVPTPAPMLCCAVFACLAGRRRRSQADQRDRITIAITPQGV